MSTLFCPQLEKSLILLLTSLAPTVIKFGNLTFDGNLLLFKSLLRPALPAEVTNNPGY